LSVARRSAFAWPILAILVASTALRGWRLGALSLWFDEAWSAFAAGQPTPWGAAAADPTNPPLYYVLLHLIVRGAGDVELVLRWGSVLVGAVGLALAFQLGRQAFGRRAGTWAALVCALSPILWWASREARMYSLLAVAVTLVALGWLRLLERPGPAAWLALAVGELAVLWSHNSGPVFVVALNAATLGVWLARRAASPPGLPRWLASQALVLALWAPWQLGLFQGLREANSAVVAGPRIEAMLALRMWEALWAGSWAIVGHEPLLLGLALGLALVAALLIPWREPAARRLVGLWLLTLVGLVAALSLLGNELHGRYLVLVAPLLLVPFGAGIARLSRRWLRWAAVTPMAVALHGVAGLTLFSGAYGNDDARAMVDLYAEEHDADDTVLAWSYADRYDLAYYWQRLGATARRVTLPEGSDLATVLPLLPRDGEVALNVWYAQRADDRGMLGCLLEHGSRRPPERHDVLGMSSYNFEAPEQLPITRSLAVHLPVGDLTAVGSLPAFEANQALCLPVTLRLAGPTEQALSVAVIARDAAGREVAHVDSVFADASQRTSRQMPAGSTVTAFPLVRLDPGTPAGPVDVVLRVYDAAQIGGYGAEVAVGRWVAVGRDGQ
jgi:4-amino-4-deoxy-L-arabinose transferase-like glycosyltransferase